MRHMTSQGKTWVVLLDSFLLDIMRTLLPKRGSAIESTIGCAFGVRLLIKMICPVEKDLKKNESAKFLGVE